MAELTPLASHFKGAYDLGLQTFINPISRLWAYGFFLFIYSTKPGDQA